MYRDDLQIRYRTLIGLQVLVVLSFSYSAETSINITVNITVISVYVITVIHGYNIYRNNRDIKDGGVVLYVKESLPEPTVNIISDKLELIELEFNPIHAKPFLIISWYRTPTSVMDDVSLENLRNTLKEADKEEKEIILIGDTSCDLKSHQNANTKKLKTIYSEYEFEQLIKTPTRVVVTTNEQNEHRNTKTLIDHFSTTKPGNILKADILPTGMVDHYMIFGIRKLNARKFRKKKPKIVETRNLKNYDKKSFRNDLSMFDWQTILGPISENPNELASIFQGILELVLEMHAPLKKGEFAMNTHHG